MFTHTITRKWSSGGATITKSEEVQGDGEGNRDVNLAASVANLRIEYALTIAELLSFYMVSTKAATVVPYNSSNVAQPQIDLQAGIPFVWTNGSGLDNPFSSNIAYIKVTNLEASVGLLSIRSLFDSTESNAAAS